MKKFVPIVISIAFTAIVGCVYFFNTKKWDNTLFEQQSMIEEYQNAINIQMQSLQQAEDNAVSCASGIDFSKVAKDDETVKSFLEMIMTWGSYEEYEAIRQKLVNEYGVSEDSTFMTTFLPAVKNKEKNGKNYNVIDNNDLNMTYEDMDSYVVKISNETYSYFTIVEWSSADEFGNEGKSKAVFTYDVSSEGNISNLEGYTIK